MKTNINDNQQQAQRFAEITKSAIISGNISRAKKFLNIAENLLENGNNEIKNAISNVYIYSVSNFMKMKNCTISNLFPKSFNDNHNKQININTN